MTVRFVVRDEGGVHRSPLVYLMRIVGVVGVGWWLDVHVGGWHHYLTGRA